jgi:hypothetical protein
MSEISSFDDGYFLATRAKIWIFYLPSTPKWKKYISASTLLLRYLGITRTFDTIAGVYDSQALDPHVNRERFRAEWWA